jgi:DNA-binding protein HU-beta
MTKLDIAKAIKKATGVRGVLAAEAVETIVATLKERLVRGERIEIRGFGVFLVKARKRGVGRNPRTGKIITIPRGRVARFKPGRALTGLPLGVPSQA